MSENTALILSGDGYNLAIAPEAEALKAELLQHSALIVEVKDATASDTARNQIKKLAAMRNLVEKSRNTVKAPVIKIGKDIDDKAKEFVSEIAAEEDRLKLCVADFAAEVERERQRILREMEAKRQAEAKAAAEAEAARIKAEQEATHAAFLAEQARKAAEAKMWEEDEAEAAKAKEEAAKAEEAARLAQVEQDRLAAERAAAAAVVTVPVFVPQAAAGTKMVPDFEVLNIDALYQYSALLVTMEPRRSEILALIKSLTKDGALPEIPGLRVFEKVAVSTR